MFSIASSLALVIKPQVLMMTTSASPGSVSSWNPAFASLSSIISASTWFFGHPRLTSPTLMGFSDMFS